MVLLVWFRLVRLRASSGLPTGATITVVYPEGFNLSAASKTDRSSYVSLQSISGQTLTYKVGVDAATSAGSTFYGFYMQTDGIINPATAGIYLIQVSTSSDPTPMSVPMALSAAGASISNATVESTSLLAGATTSHEIGFRATSGLPTGATITVVYPEGFNLSAASKTDRSSYVSLQSISGQTLTYKVGVDAATSAGSTFYGFYMQTDGIINPATAGTYLIQVSTSSDPTPTVISMGLNVLTHAITTTASPVAGGAVNCAPNPVAHGASSTCTATPNAGYSFSAFSGACTGGSCVLPNVTATKNVSATFTPNAAAQAITFGAAPSITIGGTGTVSASASSGLPVAFSVLAGNGICSISGATVTGLAEGLCSVTANQVGDSRFSAAPAAVQQFAIAAASTQTTVSLNAGWNLLGNSQDQALPVASAFGDPTQVTTVWAWDASNLIWQFYAPTLDAATLQNYATSKGYAVLSQIRGGDGFWVNAQKPFEATLPAGTAVLANNFQAGQAHALQPGWNLVAIGDAVTPMWPPARTCRNLASLKMWENWIFRVNRTWRDRHPYGLSDGVI